MTVSQDNAKTEKEIAPQIISAFTKALSELSDVLKENSEMNRQVVEQNSKPKQVTMQKSDGTTLKANVRTLN